ncbi:LacI family DNA-binding transcriptional regulator [Microbacterium pumilum]|uniref:Substrate-binding domain-containing protein n=1 Tax=Microbacterium pumilum TaxID=344165 RepID=A0ABN2S5I4_9MICO
MSDSPRRPGADGPIRPSILDVAKRAGVSTGTVSNVLNRPAIVSQEKRERVLEAIEALGFSRNKLASALAHGRSKTIGLVTIDLSNSLFVDIARGAQRRALEHGLYLQLAFADDDPTLLDAHMSALNDERVAGLLVAPMADHGEGIERSRRLGCPVVELNYDGEVPSCRVLVDNEAVGYLAARHLIDLGRTHLAFVIARVDYQPVVLRRAGVLRAVAESDGAVTLTELFAEGLKPREGARIGQDLVALPAGQRPDAVLAVTDVLAMAIVNQLASSGIRIPDDIAVMGCDHNSAAWGGAVPLTSVEMRGEEIGAAGVGLLVAELTEPADTHSHTTIILEPRLRIRESTAGRSPANADQGQS